MSRPAILFALAILAGALAFGADGQSGPPSSRGRSDGQDAGPRIIVKYREGVGDADRIRLRSRVGAVGHRSLRRLGMDVLRLPKGRDPGEAAGSLMADPSVEFAEADARVEFLDAPREVPPDPDFGLQWHLDSPGSAGYFATSSNPVTVDVDIDAPEGWAVLASAYGSAGHAAVGVLDSGYGQLGTFSPSLGYLPNHQDLPDSSLLLNSVELPADGFDSLADGNLLVDDANGWDWVDSDNAPADDDTIDNLHGTSIGGIVAAAWGSTGIAGIGRDRVLVLPLRGGNFISDYVQGIDYAIGLGEDGLPVKVLNASWKIQDGVDLQSLRDAVAHAGAHGIAVAAAAGNDSGNNDDFVNRAFPAEYTRIPLANVLAVSSTGANGAMSSFSNFGPRSVQLAAPGESILSVAGGSGGYDYNLSGTSFSTPVAAAVLAHVMAAYPLLQPNEAIERVLRGGDFDARLAGLVSSGKRVNLAGALAPFHPYSGLAYMDSTYPLTMWGGSPSSLYGSISSARLATAWSTSGAAAVLESNGMGGWAVSPTEPGIATFVLSFSSPSAPIGSYGTGPWRVTAIRPFAAQVALGQTLSLECLMAGTAAWSVLDTSVGTVTPLSASTARFTPLSEGATRIALSVDGDPVDVSGWFLVEGSVPDGGGGGGGGGCFVATAAWGDPEAPQVRALRDFRDRALNSNAVGRRLVKLYYRFSPQAAAFVERHPFLKPVARWFLWPLVLGAWLTMTGWFVPVMLLISTAALVNTQRRRNR